MRLIRKVLLGLIVLMLFSSLCLAKDEWKEKGFDFKKIKTILIEPVVGVSETDPYIKKYTIQNLFEGKILNAKEMKVIFVTYSEMEEAVGKFSQVDMKELKEKDPVRYQELMDPYLKARIDGVLKVEILELDSKIFHVPAETRMETEYRTEYRTEGYYDYSGSYGMSGGGYSPPPPVYRTRTVSVQVPYTVTRTIPAYDVTKSRAYVSLSLQTYQDGIERWRWSSNTMMTEYDPLTVVGKLFDKGMGIFRKVTGRDKNGGNEEKKLDIDEIRYQSHKEIDVEVDEE